MIRMAWPRMSTRAVLVRKDLCTLIMLYVLRLSLICLDNVLATPDDILPRNVKITINNGTHEHAELDTDTTRTEKSTLDQCQCKFRQFFRSWLSFFIIILSLGEAYYYGFIMVGVFFLILDFFQTPNAKEKQETDEFSVNKEQFSAAPALERRRPFQATV